MLYPPIKRNNWFLLFCVRWQWRSGAPGSWPALWSGFPFQSSAAPRSGSPRSPATAAEPAVREPERQKQTQGEREREFMRVSKGVYTHTHPRQKVGKHFDDPHTEYSISCVHPHEHCYAVSPGPPCNATYLYGVAVDNGKENAAGVCSAEDSKVQEVLMHTGEQNQGLFAEEMEDMSMQTGIPSQIQNCFRRARVCVYVCVCVCLPLGSQCMHGWAGGTWRRW